METKKRIRKEFLRKRDSMGEPERDRENKGIFSQISGSGFYQSADALLLFASYRNETDTFVIAKKALEDKKELFYPVVKAGEMEFYRVSAPDELKEGYRGILEPRAGEELCFLPCKNKNYLMLLPGLCFDRDGARLGYGGGYYDKYLARLKRQPDIRVTAAALAFSCQLAESGVLPREAHDISPDYIVTPDEIICL